MRDVAVIGVGMNPQWGELWEMSLRNMFTEAAITAVDDAGVDHIDALYVGCMTGGLFVGQEHLGSLLAGHLHQEHIPGVRVESACASGGLAFRQAFIDVASGMNDIVMAAGVEKMLDVDGAAATYALSTAADQEYECFHGVTFPGLYAMIAKAHMEKYGTTRKQLAEVSVKNHRNGAKNKRAQYQFETTVEAVVNAVMVADPLTVMDCSPITDGAAAAILCPLELAKTKFKKHPIIKVIGTGHATDQIALQDREDLTWLKAVELAGKRAYQMAGKKPSDIQVCEVHDCFTIAELMAYEDLGFAKPGEGKNLIRGKETYIGGRIPVNVDGGLLSKGHPIGATGGSQIRTIVLHLRGEAGEMQVKDPEIGLIHNIGGVGVYGNVTILGR